jgi:hypothetical protein
MTEVGKCFDFKSRTTAPTPRSFIVTFGKRLFALITFIGKVAIAADEAA